MLLNQLFDNKDMLEEHRWSFASATPSKTVRDAERAAGLRGPQRLFSELADMLHITSPQLIALAKAIPGFPLPSGIKSGTQGNKGYYDLATFKRWVVQNNVREIIATKN